MDLYSARISTSGLIADAVPYETLLQRIREYTLRAAFARAADEHDGDQEELRREGLRAIELFHNGRAVWEDGASFEQLRDEELRSDRLSRFESTNELDPQLAVRIDRDLRDRWRLAGYLVPSLAGNMKKLFDELEADAKDCAREAREGLLTELLRAGAAAPEP